MTNTNFIDGELYKIICQDVDEARDEPEELAHILSDTCKGFAFALAMSLKGKTEGLDDVLSAISAEIKKEVIDKSDLAKRIYRDFEEEE